MVPNVSTSLARLPAASAVLAALAPASPVRIAPVWAAKVLASSVLAALVPTAPVAVSPALAALAPASTTTTTTTHPDLLR